MTQRHWLIAIAVVAGVAAVIAVALVTSGGDADAPSEPASTPIVGTTLTATRTSTVVPTRIPTPSPSPASRPTLATSATAPAGYERSCAAAFPWGRIVSRMFTCIDEPAAGATIRPGELRVRGHAGGTFEQNVILELRDGAGTMVARRSTTATAPDIGLPGAWQTTLTVPTTLQPGRGSLRSFDLSARDGSVVAESIIEVTLAR